MVVVEKTFSCYEAFKVFVNNDVADIISWNSEISFFDRIITYTDICEIVVGLLINIINEKNNQECLKKSEIKFKRILDFEVKKTINTYLNDFNDMNDMENDFNMESNLKFIFLNLRENKSRRPHRITVLPTSNQ